MKNIPKIAFLFLTIDDIHQPIIWDAFFKGISHSKYSIYLHPKYPEKVTWHADRIIENLQPTGWGHITRAYVELIREAFKDPANVKFLVFSESDVPIRPFDEVYRAMTADNLSWIKTMKITKYKYETVLQRRKGCMHHYARFSLSRAHAERLLQADAELSSFHTMHIGDEYFLTVLHLHPSEYHNFPITFDDWEYTEKQLEKIRAKIKALDLIKNKIRISELWKKFDETGGHPKVIKRVTKEDEKKIRTCDSFFYRKFTKDSNISDLFLMKNSFSVK